MQQLIQESITEREQFRMLLITEIIEEPKIRDKQLYVQVNQSMLIRLLNKLSSYSQTPGLSEKVKELYSTISQHLDTVLNFIEDLFGNYFDRNEKVPIGYLMISINEIGRQFESLKNALTKNQVIDLTLQSILFNNFNQFRLSTNAAPSYIKLAYQKDLMNELLTDGALTSENSIREILFYFNFNNDDYVAYLYEKLNAVSETQQTKKEKIIALRFEQKNMNQLRTKLNCYYSPIMPPLKEQVNNWIEEEIKFLEIEAVPESSPKTGNEPDDKIHTSLSVAKLALLLKLMVIDKIITNRVVTHVLRIAARTVTTLQKENIAFGSMETKYHNPDRGTISAVKDILFRWINILNKL
ncbi:MAG: hypothetical protein ABIO02_02495 [Patescibacteria group bacterium]